MKLSHWWFTGFSGGTFVWSKLCIAEFATDWWQHGVQPTEYPTCLRCALRRPVPQHGLTYRVGT